MRQIPSQLRTTPTRHGLVPGGPHDGGRCLRRGAQEPEHDQERKPTVNGASDRRERRVFTCRRCRTEIADIDAVFGFAGKPAVQAHTNPAGLLFEVITLAAAYNLVTVGAPSTVFTWFTGYAWEVVCCAGCATHLGWRFTHSGEGSPASFYGLLRRRLAP